MKSLEKGSEIWWKKPFGLGSCGEYGKFLKKTMNF